MKKHLRKTLLLFTILVLMVGVSVNAQTNAFPSMKSSIGLAKKSGGFKDSRYFLWCSSVIKVDDTYHMFASAWPAQYGMAGWTTYSMCIRATSNNLLGPYTFQEVVLEKRAGYWDGDRIHNVRITKAGSKYVLYYISTANETGYAEATSITGPWTRSSKSMMSFSNPAPWIKADGSVYVFGRKGVGDVNRGQAYTAPSYQGPYTLVSNGDNLLPNNYELEDPTIWYAAGQYNVICTDWDGYATGTGKAGVQYYSSDGVNYQLLSREPINTKTIKFDDGSSTTFKRVERPYVYEENGIAKAYFLSCMTSDDKGLIIAHPVNNYYPGTTPTQTYYKIKVVNNPDYVLNFSGTPANGTNVNVYAYNGGDNQLWQLADVGSGYVKIVPKTNTNYCLDCSATPANGVNVQLWSYVANTRQQWLKTDLGNGSYKITVRANSSYGLDCSATPANGVNVQMWNYVGNNRQQWILEPVLKSGDASVAVAKKTSTLECNPSLISSHSIITYSLSSDGFTKLTLYNLQGKEIITFVNANQPSGSYTAKLDAENLSNGVYLLKLFSGKSVLTQKIVIQK